MLARSVSLSALVVAALAASGCGKSVAIGTWVAPEADIGGARRLALTDAYGRDESVSAITGFARESARASGWFDEVRVERHRLESDGDDAWLGRASDRDGDLSGGTLYVRLDVLEDSAVVSAEEAKGVDEFGNEVVVVEDVVSAHTLLSMTVADRRGVIVFEREVEGVQQLRGTVSDNDILGAMESAGRAAVSGALALITPVSQTVQIPLDDRDEDAFRVASDGADGDFAAAERAIAALAAMESTPALYNRAVLVDDNGDLAAAVALYEEAAGRGDAAGFYEDSLASAVERLWNQRALGLE